MRLPNWGSHSFSVGVLLTAQPVKFQTASRGTTTTAAVLRPKSLGNIGPEQS